MTKSILTTAIVACFIVACQANSVSAQCASCAGGTESGEVGVTEDAGYAVADSGSGWVEESEPTCADGSCTESSCADGSCGAGCAGCGFGAAMRADYSTRDEDGMVQPGTTRHMHLKETVMYGMQDHFSPNPIYAYSNAGMSAGRVHAWNKQQMAANPWHGGHSHWRWGTPTALVVPANASYGTNYAWGVGQTTSTPLYHQFGRGNAGVAFGNGRGLRPNTPYWPSSTNQFGIYPVRAPW